METRYLNVDCILRSDHSLSDIKTVLEKDVFMLWDKSSENDSHIGFETNLDDSKGPEEDIVELLRLFDSMPAELSETLSNCREKVFDIGFESGNTDDPVDVAISSDVIQKISNLGFSIKIRVYPIKE